MSRARRRQFGVLLSTLLAIAGCTSLIGADDFESSSGELCDLLGRCYSNPGFGQCESHVDDGLDAAQTEQRAQWLNDFTVYSCLSQCTNARRCLDLSPVCHEDFASCSRREECCGFLLGEADCVAQRCCRTLGAECDPGVEEQCCDAACDPKTRTCGGVQCSKVGDPCLNQEECCSRVCKDNVCEEQVCYEDGFPCGSDAECCGGFCDLDRGKCGEPPCGRIGDPCVVGNDTCCSDEQPLQCVALDRNALPGQSGVCSPVPTCLPKGAPCGPNLPECCTPDVVPDLDLYCDSTFGKCLERCRAEGETCANSGQCCSKVCDGNTGTCLGCKPSGSCTLDTQCCSNDCQAGVCAPECAELDCTHTPFELGGPLGARQPDGSLVSCDPQLSGCIDAVCKNDPFCCCQKWDVYCVEEALSLKSTGVCF